MTASRRGACPPSDCDVIICYDVKHFKIAVSERYKINVWSIVYTPVIHAKYIQNKTFEGIRGINNTHYTRVAWPTFSHCIGFGTFA